MQPCGTFDTDYGKSMAVLKTNLQWGLMIGFLILLFTAPFFSSSYTIGLLNMAGIIFIAVLGLQLLMGYCGQINLGQSAFVGVGAYTSAILVTKLGLSFWIALPCAALAAGLMGILVGIPSLRIKGFYLALATIAFQMIFGYIVINATRLTGGSIGIDASSPRLGSIVLDSEQSMYFLIMGLVVILTFFAKNIARMKAGKAFIAIRDNDIAAQSMGISLLRYKLLAFFISSVYAGIAGSLLAHYVGQIAPEYFTLMESIWYLGMVIIGGMGSISGAIFGVAFVRGLHELVGFLGPQITEVFPSVGAEISTALGLVVFGLAIVLFLILEPRGLAHRWELFKVSYRLWPFAH